jgi:hypothetical protein
MAVYFVDSRALVKRYIREIGSTWVLSLFDPALNNDVLIAAIAGVEIVTTVTRRARGGTISASDATAAETLGLRGYDAVQLAAGLEINALCIASSLPPLTFV